MIEETVVAIMENQKWRLKETSKRKMQHPKKLKKVNPK